MVSSCVILLLNIEDVFITMDTFMLGFWCMFVGHLLVWSVFLVVFLTVYVCVLGGGWHVYHSMHVEVKRPTLESALPSVFGKCLTG